MQAFDDRFNDAHRSPMALDGSDDDDDDDEEEDEEEDPAFGSIRRARRVADSPHEPAVLTPTKAPTPKRHDGFGGIRGQSSEDEDSSDDDDDEDDETTTKRADPRRIPTRAPRARSTRTASP